MSVTRRYTSADLEDLPYVEGTRYEIIDGELHVSSQPRFEHQYACHQLAIALESANHGIEFGFILPAPGLIFSPDQDVAPDLVWISRARLATALDAGGHLVVAPELVVEVLSPGSVNQRRDREIKLALYERQGVQEYWIVDWRTRSVAQYRRVGASLPLVATLTDDDVLTTSLLPDLACPLTALWPPSMLP